MARSKIKLPKDIFELFKLLVKAVVSVRYGIDTLLVATAALVDIGRTYESLEVEGFQELMATIGAVFGNGLMPVGEALGVLVIASINVLVIDVMFTAMWVAAAYGGKSEKLRDLRLPAALIAWIMYIAMWYIAGSLGDATTLVARVAGGLALAYDTWAILQEAYKDYRTNRVEETFEERRKRTREALWKRLYTFVAATLGNVMAFFITLKRVTKDFRNDEYLLELADTRTHERQRIAVGGESTGVTGATLQSYVLIQQLDNGQFEWTCKACEEVSRRKYAKSTTAMGAWKQHIRKGIPQHTYVRELL